jgi:hypothetical protein
MRNTEGYVQCRREFDTLGEHVFAIIPSGDLKATRLLASNIVTSADMWKHALSKWLSRTPDRAASCGTVAFAMRFKQEVSKFWMV